MSLEFRVVCKDFSFSCDSEEHAYRIICEIIDMRFCKQDHYVMVRDSEDRRKWVRLYSQADVINRRAKDGN